MKSWNRDDLIEMVERIIADTEEAGEDAIYLKLGIARDLLRLAKLAPKSRGRPPVHGRDKVQETLVSRLAKKRTKELIAEGVPKEAAKEKAAEEAARKLKHRNLSVYTMKRRME